MKVPGEVEEYSCLASQELMTYSCSVQASIISFLDNNELDTLEPDDVSEETTQQFTYNTASTRHRNSTGSAHKATKSQLEGELQRLLSEIAEAREAADAQAIKMDRKEKKVER